MSRHRPDSVGAGDPEPYGELGGDTGHSFRPIGAGTGSRSSSGRTRVPRGRGEAGGGGPALAPAPRTARSTLPGRSDAPGRARTCDVEPRGSEPGSPAPARPGHALRSLASVLRVRKEARGGGRRAHVAPGGSVFVRGAWPLAD